MYYISKVYIKIQSWINEKSSDNTPTFTVLTTLFNKIVKEVFFIWYEIPSFQNPVDVFTKVNMGKINMNLGQMKHRCPKAKLIGKCVPSEANTSTARMMSTEMIVAIDTNQTRFPRACPIGR